MATLTIPDETYGRLVRRPALQRVSLDELVLPQLEQAPAVPQLPLTGEDWQRAHEELMRDAAEWTRHLPPELQIDTDYYREREEPRL